MYFDPTPTTPIPVITPTEQPVEEADTPIYEELRSELGDVFDQSRDEELILTYEMWDESYGALKQLVSDAYRERVDEETRGGHSLV